MNSAGNSGKRKDEQHECQRLDGDSDDEFQDAARPADALTAAAAGPVAIMAGCTDLFPATEAQSLRTAVSRAAKPLQRYRCAACGFEAQHYFWQCPGCLSWDSYPPQRLEDL